MNNFDKMHDRPKSEKSLDAGEAIGSTRKLLLAGVSVVVLGLVGATGYLFYASRGGLDIGSNNEVSVASAPTVRNDSFAPVGKDEGDRRATLNDELAKEAEHRGESHVSQTVITEKYEVGDERDPYKKQKEVENKETPETKTEVVEKIVYRDRPVTDPVFSDDMIGKIQSQIMFAQKPSESRFVSMAFTKPDPIPPVQSTNQSTSQITGGLNDNFPNDAGYAAKPGDIFYGSLWIGFNSDDPRGAPVYATIYDNRADGTKGPLHGARLEGKVTYSDRNAALQFDKVILENGKIISVTALAVDENNARLGIAQKVDFHTFQRYSALLLSSLIEGVGDAANTMLSNNRTVTYFPDADTVSSSNNTKDEWAKAGLAALRPVGSALSSTARQGFNRPPTISADRQHRIGIVFTSLVKL